MADMTITGAPNMPGAVANDIVTHMISEKGRLSQTIFSNIKRVDPFLAALAPTKRFFPAEFGDSVTDVVLDVNRPDETDILNWEEVKQARPGYNPGAQVYKDITYGSRTVSASLYKDGWKTPAFSKIDLSFKFKRERQLQQQFEIMSTWSQDIWSHWSRRAFQRSVVNVVLNQQYGHPESLGAYPATLPSSVLTFNHCEQLFLRLRGAGCELSQAVSGYELIFIGDEELQKLCELYFKTASADYGARQNYTIGDSASRIPELNIPELGVVKKLGKYLFSTLQFPVRYRDRVAGESWEDAIVPSTIPLATERGTQTIENPDYRDPAVAKYSESYWMNLDAVTWLVPSSAMTSQSGPFPAIDYSGDFELIQPPKGSKDDPKSQTLYFLADFMSGMLATFPKRARAILSQAVHSLATDTSIDYDQYNVTATGTHYPVLQVSPLIGTLKYQLLVKGTVPADAPTNASGLFAVMESGKTHLVSSVDAREAFAGDGVFNEAGELVNVTFATGDGPDLVVDTVKSLSYLNESDVGVTYTPEVASYAVVTIRGTEIKTLHNGADADQGNNAPWATAAAAKTNIDTYLTTVHASLSCTVTGGTVDDDWEWMIRVDGTDVATNFTGHKVVVTDADATGAETEVIQAFTIVAAA